MYDIAKLLALKQITFKKGDVELLNQSVGMIPLDYLVTTQKALEKTSSDSVLYYSAKEMGVRWFKNMYNHFNISREDVIKWGINILAVAGWGEIEVPELHSGKKYYTVKVNKSTQAIEYGKADHAVCSFVRGCFASGAKVLFGGECDSVETKCLSEGHNYCEFIAQSTDKFDFNDKRIKKQLTKPEIQ